MNKALLACAAIVGLSACEAPQVDPYPDTLPPLGIASTAVWLERREASIAPPPRSQDIPTSQIRAVTSGEISAQQAVATAATVPDRGTPDSTVALAAQSFADVCVASLPSIGPGIRDRFLQVAQRDYGGSGDLGSDILVTGQQPGNINFELWVNAGRKNINRCSMSVRREDPAAVIAALVNEVQIAGYNLQPVDAPEGATQGWQIVGAPAGTVLSTGNRRNVLGQQLAGATITWR